MEGSQQRRSEIAPDTLLVASVGSATATVVIGRFGLAGTLLGAALFPVVLALAKETARRPARRLPRSLPRRARGEVAAEAQAEEAEARRRRLHDEERPGLRERLARVSWRRVLVSAGIAFAVVVGAFTLAELALGRSLVDDRPTTFFSPTGEPAPPADEPAPPPPPGEEPAEPPPAEDPAEPPPAEEPPPEPPPAEEPPAEEAP